jgi:hypothetical protein
MSMVRAFLLNAGQTYQMNSRESFFYPERHLEIDNTTMEPGVVAPEIVAYFSLVPDPTGEQALAESSRLAC